MVDVFIWFHGKRLTKSIKFAKIQPNQFANICIPVFSTVLMFDRNLFSPYIHHASFCSYKKNTGHNSLKFDTARKRVLAPSFSRHRPLDSTCPLPPPPPPLFKIFVSSPLFSVPTAFKVFQTVNPTFTQPPPALIWHNLPYT